MNYISICSGIEAATVAFHSLGWTPLAFSEIEAFPSAVLAHHYPTVPNLGDMTGFMDWPEATLAECDLLVGGPPCQAFSIAGMRNSLADARGNLTLTYVRLLNHIDQIREKHGKPPVIALYENVPGILSTRDNAFGCLLTALCGEDEAIETESGKWPRAGVLWGRRRRVGYRTLDAQYFGVAQRRRRVFVIAVPCELIERIGESADPAEILSICESLRRDTAPSREQGQETAGTLASRTGAGGFPGTDEACSGYLQPTPPICFSAKDYGADATVDLSPTLRAGGHTTSHANAGVMPAVSYAIQAGALRTNPNSGPDGVGVQADIAYTMEARAEVQAVCVTGDITHTLKAEGFDASEDGTGRGQPIVTAFQSSQSGVRLSATHATLDANNGARRHNGALVGMAVRRLMPVECSRLQAFPDDYLTPVLYRGKPAADGPMYKALGNSMCVNVMRFLGERIAKHLS